METWFPGIHLIGRYGGARCDPCGLWLLEHGGEAAILEMPPAGPGQRPVGDVYDAVRELGVRVLYLLATHTHGDHLNNTTMVRLCEEYPEALICPPGLGVPRTLSLGGEPICLVHAPKHSQSDTLVFFRGVCCTGDWELGTIRSVHDGRNGVTTQQRLTSIARLEQFGKSYHVHGTFSSHANDKRENVDWAGLMASCREDRKLW